VQFRNLRHVRLHVECRALGIDAGREPITHRLAHVLGEIGRAVVRRRQRMEIRNFEKRLVVACERDPLREDADVMSEMETARRPHARHDAASHGQRLGELRHVAARCPS
jgi:hypothetical protein